MTSARKKLYAAIVAVAGAFVVSGCTHTIHVGGVVKCTLQDGSTVTSVRAQRWDIGNGQWVAVESFATEFKYVGTFTPPTGSSCVIVEDDAK